MNKLDKGIKIKVALTTDKLESITINHDNGKIINTKFNKEPLFEAELKEDLLLEDFENTDSRLVYTFKNINYISDKIEKITLTKKMKLPHDIDVFLHNVRTGIIKKITVPYDIEINLHNERYCIETESNDYYIELLNQRN